MFVTYHRAFFFLLSRVSRAWRICGLSFIIVCVSLIVSDVYAFGQKSDICGSWNNYCKGAPSSSGDTWQPPVNTGPSPAEIERQRQAQRQREANQREATRLNSLGIDYWDRRDWQMAAKYFSKALKLNPNSSAIRKNLHKAQAELKRVKRQQAEALARRLKVSAAIKVDYALDDLSKGVASMNGPSGSFVFVQGNASPTMTVDPSFFTRPKTSLRIRYVPNPMLEPKSTWLRYVKSDRASLILDALEEGKGNLDRSIDYLDNQIIRYDSHRAASSALSYLEGLRTSYVSADAEYRKKTNKVGQIATIESKALLQAVLAPPSMRKWPGPKNPDLMAKPLNLDDWRVKRSNKMLAALEATPRDLEKTYKILRADKDIFAAANAEYYLRGVFAYWDFLAEQEGEMK